MFSCKLKKYFSYIPIIGGLLIALLSNTVQAEEISMNFTYEIIPGDTPTIYIWYDDVFPDKDTYVTVEKSVDGGAYTHLMTGNHYEHPDTGVAYGHVYRYIIYTKETNTNILLHTSQVFEVNLPLPDVSVQYELFQYASGPKVSLSWNRLYEGDTSTYVSVLRQMVGAGDYEVIFSGDVLGYNDMGVEYGKNYKYKILTKQKGTNVILDETDPLDVNIPNPTINLIGDVINEGGFKVVLNWQKLFKDDANTYSVIEKFDHTTSTWIKLFEGDVLTYSDMDVQDGKTYKYRVLTKEPGTNLLLNTSREYTAIVGVQDSGGDGGGDESTVDDSGLNLTYDVQHLSGGPKIVLSWNDHITDKDTYFTVEKKSGDGEFLQIFAGDQLSYSDMDVEYGATYFYVVKTKQKNTNTLLHTSDPLEVTPLEPSVDVTFDISQFVAGPVVNLYWNRLFEGETYVTVQKLNPDTDEYENIFSGDQIVYKDDDTEYGNEYFYKIVTKKKNVNTVLDVSDPVHVVIGQPTVTLEGEVIEEPEDDFKVELTWGKLFLDDDDTYVVVQKFDDGTDSWLDLFTGDVLNYTDEDVMDGMAYLYRILTKEVGSNLMLNTSNEFEAVVGEVVSDDDDGTSGSGGSGGGGGSVSNPGTSSGGGGGGLLISFLRNERDDIEEVVDQDFSNLIDIDFGELFPDFTELFSDVAPPGQDFPVNQGFLTRSGALGLAMDLFGHDFEEPDVSAPFIDLFDTDWDEPIVTNGYDEGIVMGYRDNTFKGEKPVTLAEALAILFRSSELDEDDLKNGETLLSDENAWFYDYMAAGVNLNLVDQRLKNAPHRVLSPEQFLDLLIGIGEESL